MSSLNRPYRLRAAPTTPPMVLKKKMETRGPVLVQFWKKKKFRLQFQFWKPDPLLVPGNLV